MTDYSLQYLQKQMNELRGSFAALHEQNKDTDARLDALEARLQKSLERVEFIRTHIRTCRTPGCVAPAQPGSNYCCDMHEDIYPHECEAEGCGVIIPYDFAAYCTDHAFEGNNDVVIGYSAYDRYGKN